MQLYLISEDVGLKGLFVETMWGLQTSGIGSSLCQGSGLDLVITVVSSVFNLSGISFLTLCGTEQVF